MWSKNKAQQTSDEALHVTALTELMQCSLCDATGFCDIHEIEQGMWYTALSLCRDCHLGSRNGWHGQKAMWKLKKMEPLDVLEKQIGRMFYGRR